MNWRQRISDLKDSIHALYFVARDPLVPLPVKLFIAGIVAYALSPIDLIPDFIPLLGYLDDLLLLPLFIWMAIKLIPKQRWAAARAQAATAPPLSGKSIIAAAVIITFWLALLGLIAYKLW